LTATAADVSALVRMFLDVLSSTYSDKRDAARYNHAPCSTWQTFRGRVDDRHAIGDRWATMVSDEVRLFFEEFERNSTDLNLDRIGAQFADVFMNADPERAGPVPKAAFLAALPQREKMFSAIGVNRIRLLAVRETVLDPMHTLAATDWIAELKDGDELPLASTFLLRRKGASFVVVFYLNHQDIGRVIAARSDPLP
jgi:hypothetical protein